MGTVRRMRFSLLASHDSYSDTWCADEMLELRNFWREVLEIYPSFRDQVLHLSDRFRYTQFTDLRYLWKMVAIVQDHKDHISSCKRYIAENRGHDFQALRRTQSDLEYELLQEDAISLKLEEQLQKKREENEELKFELFLEIQTKKGLELEIDTIKKQLEDNQETVKKAKTKFSEQQRGLLDHESDFHQKRFSRSKFESHQGENKKGFAKHNFNTNAAEIRLYRRAHTTEDFHNFSRPVYAYKKTTEMLVYKQTNNEDKAYHHIESKRQFDQLTEENKRLKDANNTLENEVHRLKQATQEMPLKYTALYKRVQQLTTENANLIDEIQSLNRDLNQEKENAIMNEKKCADDIQVSAELRNKIKQLLEEKKNLIEQLTGNSQMLKSKTKENESLKATVEIQEMVNKRNFELKNEVKKLTEENKSLKDDLKHANIVGNERRSFENLQETNKTLQIDNNNLNNQKQRLQDDLIREKENLKKLEVEYNKNILSMKKQMERQELEIVSLKAKLTEASVRKSQVDSRVSINEERCIHKGADEIQKRLSDDNAELQNKIKQLLQEKKDLTEQYKKAHGIASFRENTDALQREIEQLRGENQRLNKEVLNEKDNAKIKHTEFIKMQQRFKSQTEENERLKATVEIQERMNKRNLELQNEVHKLLEENKNLTDDLKRANEIGKDKEKPSFLNLQEVNQTLQMDINKLNNQNQRLQDDIIREKEKVKKIEVEYNKRSSNLQKQMEIQEHEIVSLKAKLTEASVRKSKGDSSVDSNQDVQQRLQETMNQLKLLQKELDDTKSRLSRAMGDRLTDNNPNIADLSDKNRPTKISERYQELYDNQWTDAFEIANGTYRNEEKTIHLLRDILMDTLEFCKTQATNQMIQIRASFLKGEDLPENMNKQVKECRKAMAELYGKGLYREYCDQLRSSKPERISTQSYVRECFEICWLMAVQDPPVVFGPDIRRGDNFNKDHYKAYTRSGERVDFVVWPVLLLHQNGPVLCKGVAQGK